MSRYPLRLLLVWLLLTAVVGAQAITVSKQDNRILIDGVPTALTFARGCDSVVAVPAYRQLGFNTLLITVDSPGSVVLERAALLADAAEAQGLYVLIELANGSWSAGQRAALGDEKYIAKAKDFVQSVIPHFQERANLVGWIISTVPEDRQINNLGTFAEYLQDRYRTLEGLNAAWAAQGRDGKKYSSRVPTFTAVDVTTAPKLAASIPEVQQLVQQDIDDYLELVALRDREFQQYLSTRYPSLTELNRRWTFQFESWDRVRTSTVLQREKDKPGSSPLSLMEYARFQQMCSRMLMDYWAQQILAEDRAHLLFAGGQFSYRTLISLPPSVHGAFTECYPGVAEVDLDAHNPQAIDIARRGNRFIVLAGVLARNIDPYRFTNYLYTAAVHGAAGVGVMDWAQLTASPPHAESLRAALPDLARRGLLNRTPLPRVAFVYSPYALGPPVGGRALYGYMTGFLHYGPGIVFSNFRQGTNAGQIDYLAPEDLPALSLSRYRVLLLPSVLDFPEDAQQALATFVGEGGTAVADLGLGAMQSGLYHYLPPEMMKLFGVINVPGLSEVRLNLEVYRAHPRFPRLIQGLRTTGLRSGYMISQAARVKPMPGTDLLFQTVASDEIKPPRPRQHEPLDPRKETRGMFIVARGRGQALYAPLPLYQWWTSGNLLYEEFHRDLFSYGSDVELEQPVDFLTPFSEVAVYADGGMVMWSKNRQAPVARVRNPQRQLFAGFDGYSELTPEGTWLRANTAGFHAISTLPLFVEPAPFRVLFSLTQADARGYLFDIGADDDHADQPVTLRLGNGAYRIIPGSSHHVSVVSPRGNWVHVVTADAQGVLRVKLPSARCNVMISGAEPVLELDPSLGHTREVEIDAVPARQSPSESSGDRQQYDPGNLGF